MVETAKTIVRISLILLLALAACLIFPRRTAEAEPAKKPASPPAAQKPAATLAAIQTARNVGKAYYEQGKYPEAIDEFQKVIASRRAVATDFLNLGLALMQANKLNEALGALTTAQQMAPKLIATDYNLGILYKRELRYPDAEAALRRVTDADPNDPAAWFNLGTVLFAQKKLEDAFQAHQQVVRMGFGRGQNFYVASLFHSFTTLVRLKRTEEAQKFLKMHEKVRDSVPNISLQNPALEGGKYGVILVPKSPTTTIARTSIKQEATFVDVTARTKLPVGLLSLPGNSASRLEIAARDYSLDFARRSIVPLFGPRMVTGDYDNDGRSDLYVIDPAGTNRLFRNEGDGTFVEVTEKVGVAGPGASLAATFADYDNSGHASLFVAGLGGVRLYRNNGEGTFVDETEKAGLPGSEGDLATSVTLFDADNDGFLDLVVTIYTDLATPPDKPTFTFPDDFAGGQTRFFRNNGDGTFADLTSSSGFAEAKGRWRKALFADLDDNGYADVLLVRDDASPLLFLGRGEAKFNERTITPGSAQSQNGALDAQVADFNHDGNFDLVLWTTSGCQVLLNRGGARFASVTGLAELGTSSDLFAFRGTVADLNGDSFDDLLVADGQGKLHFLANRTGRFQEAPLTLPLGNEGRVVTLVPGWLAAPGALNLVALLPAGQLKVLEKEGTPTRWLEVKMSGMKSNTEGIGGIVELKAGNYYKKVLVTGDRLRLNLGELPRLDVVRVTWPNAVVQNWIHVATNKPLEVRESERLASSCPFVYVWNGERFVYFTDVLGVAPLGHLLPDATYIRPNPEEYVRLPEWMRPRNGRFIFQLTNELREVDYFDHARLLAVDHPAREEVYANEIFSGTPAPPTLHVVKRKQYPVAARDQRGRNVLPLLREANGQFVAGFRRLKIPGLAEPHALELDLGKLPPDDPVALYLRGWVYWTDSNSHRALVSNSTQRLITPYVQVRDPKGQWVTVVSDMGLPSGTNRTMRLDLTGKFLTHNREVRIVTNMCVYWDEVFFTTEEGPGPEPKELPLVAAELNYRGFSTPVLDPEGVKPEYFEYREVLAEAPWDPMAGNYTRYGDVAELVRAADDQMVITSTGDQLTVEFDASVLPPLRPGWKRTFFLYAHGWAKDGEPNTAYSKTVDPLPFRSMSAYPYPASERYPQTPANARYLRDYQTRPHYKLIPPLAPPIGEGQ